MYTFVNGIDSDHTKMHPNDKRRLDQESLVFSSSKILLSNKDIRHYAQQESDTKRKSSDRQMDESVFSILTFAYFRD